MIVNGRAIAKEIRDALATQVVGVGRTVSLGIVMADADAATEQYVRVKGRFAESIGVNVVERRFDASATTEEVVSAVHALANEVDGIVVQLPLPSSIDVAEVLRAVPVSKDIDVLSPEAQQRFVEEASGALVPPVAGAVEDILKRNAVNIADLHIVVIGTGALVGKPVTVLLRQQGAGPRVLNRMTPPEEARAEIAEADVIISGAGSPHMITSDMIKPGVVLIDAGTSESNGAVAGDIDPGCAEKASVFTPVPGGVGPIAVAKLFENLLKAYTDRT